MDTKPKAGFPILIIAYTAFVGLGLGGLLGVAWPSIRRDFGVELDSVGLAMLVGTLGYLSSSFVSGRMIAVLGVGRLLAIAAVLQVVGFFATAASPSWAFYVLIGGIGGLGSGTTDAVLNTYIATHHGPKQMNWLHAFFGVGASIAPLIMTAVLNLGLAWRWGYAIVGLAQIVLVVAFILTIKRWDTPSAEARREADSGPVVRARFAQTLTLPLVWISILLFLSYTGTEATGGQWAYTLFTEGRGIDITTAGTWVSIYWAALTVGRVVLGWVVEKLGSTLTLRLCMAGAALGSVMIASNLGEVMGFAGLGLLGFAQAPIFPTLVSETPRKVGNEHAANAIGFQVGSAGAGFALLPGLAGVLARNIGLETIGVFLVVMSVLMFTLHELTLLPRWYRKQKEDVIADLEEEAVPAAR